MFLVGGGFGGVLVDDKGDVLVEEGGQLCRIWGEGEQVAVIYLARHEDWLQGDRLSHCQLHELPETHVGQVERGVSNEAVHVGQDLPDVDGHADNFPDVIAVASSFDILGQFHKLAVEGPDDKVVVVFFGLDLNISEDGVVVESQEL